LFICTLRPIAEGEDERSGRWRGQQKTECGIHNTKSRFAQYLREQERKRQEDTLQRRLQSSLTVAT
jgi:phosphoadenosine phosphosulfate reductase